mmetsp:Transcript_30213/g.51451  ORF Transcript_30213/g.51451 Transcript_30213/m.51451 type:complete len:95 (+) Transcript_30213:1400-1684(+)
MASQLDLTKVALKQREFCLDESSVYSTKTDSLRVQAKVDLMGEKKAHPKCWETRWAVLWASRKMMDSRMAESLAHLKQKGILMGKNLVERREVM